MTISYILTINMDINQNNDVWGLMDSRDGIPTEDGESQVSTLLSSAIADDKYLMRLVAICEDTSFKVQLHIGGESVDLTIRDILRAFIASSVIGIIEKTAPGCIDMHKKTIRIDRPEVVATLKRVTEVVSTLISSILGVDISDGVQDVKKRSLIDLLTKDDISNRYLVAARRWLGLSDSSVGVKLPRFS